MNRIAIAALVALFPLAGSAQQKEKMPIPYGTLPGFGISASVAWDECGESVKCKAMIRRILELNAMHTMASVVPNADPKPPKVGDILYEVLTSKD